jgi:soluble lytic murein transglycosylase-like protein
MKRKITIREIFILFFIFIGFIFSIRVLIENWHLEKQLLKYQNAEKHSLIIPLQYHFNNYLDTVYSIASYLTGLDIKYFYAVSEVESNHNPLVTGDHGKSIGLFQVQSYEWREFLKNPLINSIIFGIILKGLEQHYGHITLALAVYNGGPRNPNLSYVKKVLKALKNLNKNLNKKEEK